jgi:hypothetical protein
VTPKEIAKQSEKLADYLQKRLADRAPMTVIKAPPGAGKTYLLVQTILHGLSKKMRLAVAAQTNSQADEVCDRIHSLSPKAPLFRFVSGSYSGNWQRPYRVTSSEADLPDGPCIVVGTSAKWGAINPPRPFHTLFVEEAWQLKMADFLPLCQVADCFILIGDPGQIPPVVTVDAARWATSLVPPHFATPDVLLERQLVEAESSMKTMPATRRLPHDTAELVQEFYDFNFASHAQPGERELLFKKSLPGALKGLSDVLSAGSVVGATIATDKHGPPLEADRKLAATASQIVDAVLQAKTNVRIGDKVEQLLPTDIGVAATHRAMVQELSLALPSSLRDQVMVDTPERWQGLERKFMIVVHPLSNVAKPSEFDLETGRLCVMTSRHKAGLVVLSRDHVDSTLEAYDPPANQPLGRPDHSGRGHFANQSFLNRLIRNHRWQKVG